MKENLQNKRSQFAVCVLSWVRKTLGGIRTTILRYPKASVLLLVSLVGLTSFSPTLDMVEPDLLLDSHGNNITTLDAWEKRRPEIMESFQSLVFGRTPDTPYEFSWEVLISEDALEGRATLQIVELTITTENKATFSFPVNIFLPNNGKNNSPAFVLIDHRPPQDIDPYTKEFSEYWPVPSIIDQGFATASFWAGHVDPDDKKDDFMNGIHPILDVEPRTDESWACIASWAWGASRVLDYLQQVPRVDSSKVAVIGHSRGGKAALWAAAQDQRFAMVVSNDSGCTGAALSRRKANGWHGETIKRINTRFPHWFSKNYRQYNRNEDNLPIDQHMLLAMIAPRALYVASATRDHWADPVGEYMSLRAAAPVWSLYFDNEDPLPPKQPNFFHASHLSYHLRPGKHDLVLYDWMRYIKMARRVFGMSCIEGNDLPCIHRHALL